MLRNPQKNKRRAPGTSAPVTVNELQRGLGRCHRAHGEERPVQTSFAFYRHACCRFVFLMFCVPCVFFGVFLVFFFFFLRFDRKAMTHGPEGLLWSELIKVGLL